MASLKLVTWNVRGLRAKPKRVTVLSHFKSLRADVSVLVETHITGQMQMALQKTWVGWFYQAPYTSSSCGVAVLIAKSVQFQLHLLQSDPQGQYLLLHTAIGDLEVLLMAFYIPPPFQFAVLQEGVTFMAQHPTVPTVWMGDFNITVEPTFDRLHSSAQMPPQPLLTRFGRFLSEFAMIDTWRHKHLTTVAYSCFTPSQSAMSRIDMIMISPTLVPDLLDVGFGVRVLSDHSPYWMTLRLPSAPLTHMWRLHQFWFTIM